MECHICFDEMKNDYLDTCDECIENITKYITSTKKIQRTECDIINFTIFFFRKFKVSKNVECFICNETEYIDQMCKKCHKELYKQSLILLHKDDEFISTIKNALCIQTESNLITR